MEKYEVKSKIRVIKGPIGLEPGMTVGRMRRIRMVKKDIYEILVPPIIFKPGDIIGLENPDKELLKNLKLIKKKVNTDVVKNSDDN